jgi:hypothetical protein
MGGPCSTHGKDEKCIQNFSRITFKGRDHLGNLGVGGRLILKLS